MKLFGNNCIIEGYKITVRHPRHNTISKDINTRYVFHHRPYIHNVHISSLVGSQYKHRGIGRMDSQIYTKQ